MKAKFLIVFGATMLAAFSTFAQGTMSFGVTLDGAHAVPPNSSTRQSLGGSFTLDPGSLFFSGSVGLIDYSDATVTIFRSTSASDLGTRLYDFTPGGIVAPGPDPTTDPGSRSFDFARTLTSSEASDLASGSWWVNVITPGFPNGEIRGQITAVPEPSTYALFACGTLATLIPLLQKRRKRALTVQK